MWPALHQVPFNHLRSPIHVTAEHALDYCSFCINMTLSLILTNPHSMASLLAQDNTQDLMDFVKIIGFEKIMYNG